jgi:peptidoglycan/LPS O-acetylase OafA/YrhL
MVPAAHPFKTKKNREMAISGSRFEALDAWRGLSAVLVAMFHLQAYSHIYDLALLRHSYLFVDFFFVLSGFVITASYRTKLSEGFSFWRFMLLRFGRLYPLHVAILAAFIAVEVLRFRFSGLLSGATGDKFSGPHSIEAIFSNLLLIQGLGVEKMLTWNMPSWSISVEFYTYAVFAIALLIMRRWIYAFIALVILVAPLLLLTLVGQIDTDYDFGIIRCLFGFFIGFGCYDLYLLINQMKGARSNSITMSAIESCSAGLVILFVCLCGSGPLSLAAPFVFGLAVIVFSLEGGVLSNILKTRPFIFLGTLSYSIYMVHALVLIAMTYAFQLAERRLGIALFNEGHFGARMWQGDLSYGILICLVLAFSYLTYNFIEKPGRRQSRNLSDRIFARAASSRMPSVSSIYAETSRLGDEGHKHQGSVQQAARL